MIKIRGSLFETNSSSVHSLILDKNISGKEDTSKITPIVDLSLVEDDKIYKSFNEKITFLFAMVEEDEKLDIEIMDALNYHYDTEGVELDISYAIKENIKYYDENTGEEKNLRDVFLKEKQPLFDIVKDLTGKDIEIKNLDLLDPIFVSSKVFDISNNHDIKKILTNKSINIVSGELHYMDLCMDDLLYYDEFSKIR